MQTKVIVALCAIAASTPAAARCKNGDNVSWYGEPQRVRSGKVFDPDGETCAHRTLPDGAVLRLTMAGRIPVDCTVNDWGPQAWTGCKVDVSRKIARRLGIVSRGTGEARIEVVRRGPPAG